MTRGRQRDGRAGAGATRDYTEQAKQAEEFGDKGMAVQLRI